MVTSPPAALPNKKNMQLPCYTMPISGRFDVGGLPTYIECDAAFAAMPSRKSVKKSGLGGIGVVVAFVALASTLRLASASAIFGEVCLDCVRP